MKISREFHVTQDIDGVYRAVHLPSYDGAPDAAPINRLVGEGKDPRSAVEDLVSQLLDCGVKFGPYVFKYERAGRRDEFWLIDGKVYNHGHLILKLAPGEMPVEAIDRKIKREFCGQPILFWDAIEREVS